MRAFFKFWRLAAIVARRLYGAMLKPLFADCGNGFSPGFPLITRGAENIRIGRNFRSMGNVFLYGNEGKFEIGDNVSLNTNVLIGSSGGGIKICNDVLIGPNVVLRAADHGLLRNSLINKQPHDGGVIIVEDDVWIGANAVILKNVRLARGSVIAAGAVVTSDTEPYSIVGGIPAKKISTRR